MVRKEFLETLNNILAEHGTQPCPSCGRVLDDGDIAWNNGCTDSGYGTPCSSLEVICQECDTNIVHVTAWRHIEDYEDIIHVLEEEWGDA